ncbi:MAG TPA: GNAT family N-acetyltransferase [Acidimicrobiales bacterium]|nr:GNAT family N-acetyltransferase [Acidimicrobiales bacterium]
MAVGLDTSDQTVPHRVRPAGTADLDMVVDCQTQCWDEAYRGIVASSYLDDPQVAVRRRERWARRLAGDRSVLLASLPATPGLAEGVASFGPSRDDPPEPPLELMSLYIRARWHGSGLADRLLVAAIGEESASLWVFTVNARAQAFYRRHGFEPDGAEHIDPDTGLTELRMVR